MSEHVALTVREMTLDEVPLVIEYFHAATPEYLETLGVDPTRLPARSDWLERYRAEHDRPLEQRRTMLVLWSDADGAIGFSTADKIMFGDRARMHLTSSMRSVAMPASARRASC